MGSVIHSSHVTGRMWFSPSISRAVATFVAIRKNASAGVRMLIACQLRLSTSTIDLFSMSVIKFDAKVFILCWCLRTAAENWLPRLALLQGACARPPPVSETGALLIMQRGNGRLRNLQKRKTRGDSHCYFQDTSASGLSTQNTKYGVFASRRCMRIRKGLSKI